MKENISRRNVLSNVGKGGIALSVGGALGQQSVVAATDPTESIAAYLAPNLSIDFSNTSVTTVSTLTDADILLVGADEDVNRSLVVDALQSGIPVAAIGSQAQLQLLATVYDVPSDRLVPALRNGSSLPSDLDFQIAAAVDPSQPDGFTVLIPRGNHIDTHTYDVPATDSDVIAAKLQDTFTEVSSIGTESTSVPGGCGKYGHFQDPWNCIGTVKQVIGDCPHGEVEVYTTVAYVDEGNERYFGVEQEFDIRPGKGEFSPCNTDWENSKLEVANEYFDVGNGDGRLLDVQPNNTAGKTSETTSINVGVTADTEKVLGGSIEAGWSETYTQPGINISHNEYPDQGIGGNDVSMETANVQDHTTDFTRSCVLAFPKTTDGISWSNDTRMTFKKPGFWFLGDKKKYTKTEILSFS